jgi:alpha-tubulin suppressor-like RCC1 family protein
VAAFKAGYRFVNWTGDVGSIASVNDATTTVIMNDRCSITANFEDVNFMVAAGYYHTVGLRSDGTVVAVGDDECGQCNVHKWTNTIQVASGSYHALGVKSDGTLVAVGWDDFRQCAVGTWDLN